METKDRIVVVALLAASAVSGSQWPVRAAQLTRFAFPAPPFGSAGIRAEDTYPLQSTSAFTLLATLTNVDVERDRLSLKADDGRKFVADAYDTKIIMLDRSRKGEVGDLVPGMRVRITGYLLSPSIIAADQLRVLPLAAAQADSSMSPARPPQDVRQAPSKTAKGPSVSSRYYHPEPIRLRGTVDSVDDAGGTIVVRVKDHTRTVLVSSSTDLTDITDVDDTHIGINPGDRITVQGMLQQNGSVKATVVSRSRDIQKVATHITGDTDTDHQLIGHVSHTSSKISSRDIKIMVRPGHEVEIEVGHSIPVLRHGERISVHDLTLDDVVRVQGDYDGDAFKATQIEVLEAYP